MGISHTNGISLGDGLIEKPLVIRDKTNINNIAMEFRRMSKYSPNHPMSEWDIFLVVNFKDNTKSWVEIYKNNDGNGCLIRIEKVTEFSVTNLGVYRNDNLGELIENIVSGPRRTFRRSDSSDQRTRTDENEGRGTREGCEKKPGQTIIKKLSKLNTFQIT